jgi:hypothetical protein
MVTKKELKKHLSTKGWREDNSGNALIGEFAGRKLRTVLKERVFRVEELLIGKD